LKVVAINNQLTAHATDQEIEPVSAESAQAYIITPMAPAARIGYCKESSFWENLMRHK
jgi:hypothetical protein